MESRSGVVIPTHQGRKDMKRFLNTEDKSWALFVQRVVLGLVIFPHGAQKLFGWVGGYGFSGTMGFFTGTMHLPAPIALLVILIEALGAAMLVFGVATRLSALGISLVMAGAVFSSHLHHGFFM